MTIKQLKKRRIFAFANPKRADVFADRRTKRCRTRNAKLLRLLNEYRHVLKGLTEEN